MHIRNAIVAPSAVVFALAVTAHAAPRDVQFKSVDFEDRIVEVHNFGDTAESLDGWRTCSHDENMVRQYSSFSGFNGLSIPSGESLFIHFDNDSSDFADGEQRIDIAGRGSFAGPLDGGPFAIQFYFPPVQFFNGDQIADHVQWSVGGVDDFSADERSDEAQSGGVWTDQSAWVSTTDETERIELTDETGAELHGPMDYEAVEPSVPCPGDCDSNGSVNFSDLVATLSEFGGPGSNPGCDADDSGAVNFSDLVATLSLFGPCP